VNEERFNEVRAESRDGPIFWPYDEPNAKLFSGRIFVFAAFREGRIRVSVGQVVVVVGGWIVRVALSSVFWK
jgi:hypothetical protein